MRRFKIFHEVKFNKKLFVKPFKKRLLGLTFFVASLIDASGMSVPFYSVDGASTANANAAEGEAPSTIVGNPAGLVYLDGTQLENNIFVLQPDFRYENGKGYSFNTHETVHGSNSGNIGHRLEIPGLFFSHRLSEKTVLGLGLYAPFGADFSYPLDSVMRYNGNRAKIISVILNPTLALKINEKHSIGLGFYILYSMSKLRQFADLTYGLNTYIDRIVPFINGRYVLPAGTFEGYASLRGDAWKYGFNLGWLWDVNDVMRLGLSYRSKSSVHFKGDVSWNMYGPTWALPIAGPVVEHIFRRLGYSEKEEVTFTFHYPELWQLHGMWKVSNKLNLLGNIAYSRNSRQYALHINWNKPKMVPDARNYTRPNLTARDFTEIVINFRDTWRASVGGNYQYSDPLQLRFGIMYAKSAVRSPKYRLPITPDEDRVMLGLGVNYKYSKNLILGFSYNFMKLKNAKINAGNYCGGAVEFGPKAISCVDSRGRAQGVVKSKANIIGMSFKYRF